MRDPGELMIGDPLLLRRQPEFARAIMFYCETMIEPAPQGWPVRKLLNQLGRYYAAYMLIRQYYGWRAGGDELPTLSQLQVVSGLSPRQTVSFVATLRMAGLVSMAPYPHDRRQKILAPSPALVAEIGRSCTAFIAAFHILAGDPDPVWMDAHRMGRIIHVSANRVLENGTLLAAFPTVEMASTYDCGYQLLVTLMAAHYRRQAGQQALPTAHSALSRRFQVSQSHVGNVMSRLRQSGALQSSGTRVDAPADHLVDEFENWCAAEMLHYAGLARRVLTDQQVDQVHV